MAVIVAVGRHFPRTETRKGRGAGSSEFPDRHDDHDG